MSLCFQVLCASGPGALANVTRVLGQDLRGDTAEDLTARVTVSGDELILPGDLVRAVVGPRREVVRKIRASRGWCCSCCELSRNIYACVRIRLQLSVALGPLTTLTLTLTSVRSVHYNPL